MYLWDAQQAAERIARFLAGKTFDDYLADEQLRNVLIHGYATVDDRLVWGVVESSLPGLRSRLRELLND